LAGAAERVGWFGAAERVGWLGAAERVDWLGAAERVGWFGAAERAAGDAVDPEPLAGVGATGRPPPGLAPAPEPLPR